MPSPASSSTLLWGAVLSLSLALSSAAEVTSEPQRAPAVLFLHFVFMATAWFFLLPLGVIFANRGRAGYGAKEGAWFKLHTTLQYAGWVLQIAGFICAVIYVQLFGLFGHFVGEHEVIGLIVVVLGTLQPLNAFFRPHKGADGEKTPTARRAWEVLHKGSGYACILGSIAAVITGIRYLFLLNYDVTTYSLAIALVAAFGSFWISMIGTSFTDLWPETFRFFAGLVGAVDKTNTSV